MIDEITTIAYCLAFPAGAGVGIGLFVLFMGAILILAAVE